MPRRSDSPIWVQGLRAQLRSTVGPAYRLVEQRGKAKLDVRYADGSRGTAVLPVQWVPAQARQIQEAVERVAQKLSMGRTLRQSLELIEGTSSPAPAPAAGPAGRELLAAWEAFGKHKVHRTGQIKASTWLVDYGKTAKRLHVVATNCFYSIFLQCATGLFKQTFCYPTRWTPPAILRSYVGEKVASRSDGIPLSDEQIEVGAFCWTDLPLDIVNPGLEERVSIQLKTSWGVLPPRKLWGLTWP